VQEEDMKVEEEFVPI